MSSVNSLEYNDIRNSIINFLRQDPYFKDFNFEASNISRIVNMLAYSSMYNGYYMKMLLDESMADSARTKTALIGHANSRNYLTKFITAPKALIKLTVDAEEIEAEEVPYIQISKGQQFKGTNNDGKTIYFIAPYDVTLLYDAAKNEYSAEDFMIIQGQYRTQTHNVLDPYKKYTVNDNYCDDTTISVRVKSNKDATNSTEYVRNHNFYGVQESDLCYYITASTNGIYQIHFGHNIFGREPRPGEQIEITYIKTDGSSANDTGKFDIVLAKTGGTPPTNINYYKPAFISINTLEAASGGLDSESIDELRFGILNHSRQRGRVITSEDIKSVILSEFRDVESISVWSGGSAKYRQYGKTYISIKPKTGELLTHAAKKVISDLMINQYGIISKTDLIFVDPNFTDILLDIKFRLDRSKTNNNASVIKADIEKGVTEFNKDILSKFDTNYYDADLTGYIKNKVTTISSLHINKRIQKTLFLNFGSGRFQIDFGNPLKNITSSEFAYGDLTCKLTVVNNSVLIIDHNNKNIATIGTADIENGTLDIIIPQYVSTELLNIIGETVYPDVNTLEDNIVRIKSINVTELV